MDLQAIIRQHINSEKQSYEHKSSLVLEPKRITVQFEDIEIIYFLFGLFQRQHITHTI